MIGKTENYLTPEERARQVHATIEVFGWKITHSGTVPDDGWPIDIIAKAIRDAEEEALSRDRV
jgi:hypothetical protein